MKKLYFLLFAISMSAFSFGQVILSDDFTYPDGDLVNNAAWDNHSGSGSFIQVSGGQAVLVHGSGSREDANTPFTPVAGEIFFGIDFSVSAGSNISGSDNEYFMHFKDGGSGFRGRVDIVEPSSGGNYSIGISSSTSTAQATWATDLTFGVTYRATVGYDQDTGLARLWIDASSLGDTNISGTPDGATSISAFALRQSTSAENETITVDNLIVAQSFGETLSTNDFSVKTFGVYPNPTSVGSVNIVPQNGANGKLNVAVFDVLGKQVINTVMANETLDVSSLNTGVYIMKITQGNATSTKKLVIK